MTGVPGITINPFQQDNPGHQNLQNMLLMDNAQCQNPGILEALTNPLSRYCSSMLSPERAADLIEYHQENVLAKQQAARDAEIEWKLSRAVSWAEEGHAILDRMAFWREIPLLGRFMLWRLASGLDRITDQVEGYLV